MVIINALKKLEEYRVDGKMPVWWDFEEAEADRIKSELRGDPKAEEIVRERKSWADQLFHALLK